MDGHYKRTRPFVESVGAAADRVELLCLVPRCVVDTYPAPAELDRIQTGYWGSPVGATWVA